MLWLSARTGMSAIVRSTMLKNGASATDDPASLSMSKAAFGPET